MHHAITLEILLYVSFGKALDDEKCVIFMDFFTRGKQVLTNCIICYVMENG